MIHPLVIYTNRTFYRCQMRDGILSKYSDSITVDQIRDTVMDFGINVVWASCENNTVTACFFQIFQSLLALFLHIAAGSSHFFPSFMCRSFDFFNRDILEFLYQTLGQDFLRGKRKERIAEINGRII